MSKSNVNVGAGAAPVKAGGLRQRSSGSSKPKRAPQAVGGAARGPSSAGAGILRFYTEDSPGLKVQPTVVLILSLLFIGFVIIMHLWGKFNR